MAKVTFDESEIYLLRNWSSACRLEEAMNRVRYEKYHSIITRVAELLVDQLGNSEYGQEVFATQKWGDGFIYFWMKKWGKSGETREVPYFCLDGLRLEHLLSDEANRDKITPPYACLHAKYLRKAGWDLSRFRNKLNKAAAKILKNFPERNDEDDANPICYEIPEGRAELKRLLLEDEEGFANLLIEHGLRLAELSPAITNVLAGPK